MNIRAKQALAGLGAFGSLAAISIFAYSSRSDKRASRRESGQSRVSSSSSGNTRSFAEEGSGSESFRTSPSRNPRGTASQKPPTAKPESSPKVKADGISKDKNDLFASTDENHHPDKDKAGSPTDGFIENQSLEDKNEPSTTPAGALSGSSTSNALVQDKTTDLTTETSFDPETQDMAKVSSTKTDVLNTSTGASTGPTVLPNASTDPTVPPKDSTGPIVSPAGSTDQTNSSKGPTVAPDDSTRSTDTSVTLDDSNAPNASIGNASSILPSTAVSPNEDAKVSNPTLNVPTSKPKHNSSADFSSENKNSAVDNKSATKKPKDVLRKKLKSYIEEKEGVVLPQEMTPKFPDYILSLGEKIIQSADNKEAFEKNLNVLRESINVRGDLVDDGRNMRDIADKQVENILSTKVAFELMRGDEESQRAALEEYHKIVLQTGTAVTLPRKLEDFDEAKYYNIVQKCLKTGTLSEEEKVKVQNILQYPQKFLTMRPEVAEFLGRLIESSTAVQAAETLKTYFSFSPEMMDEYSCYISHSKVLSYNSGFNHSKGRLYIGNVVSSLDKPFPAEVKDELLYRENCKKEFAQVLTQAPHTELLESQVPHTELLEVVRRNDIPSIATIKEAIELLPKEDVAYMARFARLLLEYVMYVAYEKSRTVPKFDPKPVKKVRKYCGILIRRYVELPTYLPRDERITKLPEWKAYLADKYNVQALRKLCQALVELEIDPSAIARYVEWVGWTLREEERKTENYDSACDTDRILESTVELYRMRYRPGHPYYELRKHMFDPLAPQCLIALKQIKGLKDEDDQSKEAFSDGFLMRHMRTLYSAITDQRLDDLLKE